MTNIEFSKEWIANLKFLANKEEVLASSAPIQHSIGLLIEEIENDGFKYMIDARGYLMVITFPGGKQRVLHNGDYGFDSSALKNVMKDKVYTSWILRKAGFKVAEDFLLSKSSMSFLPDEEGAKLALDFAERVGFPLILKPNGGSLGRNVEQIFTREQLIKALERFQHGGASRYVLQPCIAGQDYRVLYLDGEILAAYERIPPKVIGDGQHTLRVLIAMQTAHVDIQHVESYLRDQGMDMNAVIAQGEQIRLLPTANIATGGTVREIEVSDQDRIFLSQVAKCFGARYFGIDILAEGALHEGTILEINKSPITTGISQASSSFQKSFAKKIRKTIKSDEGL